METEIRPETPSLDKNEEASDVASDISKRLGSDSVEEVKEKSDAPIAKNPKMVDLNNLTTDQVQDLQELFANTPKRAQKKDETKTIELRQIDGKTIVEWGKTFFDLKNDPTQRRDVLTQMIPIRFHGSDKFVDVRWREDFFEAEKVTCKILKWDKEDVAEVVGTTLKRDSSGGITSQEVEMYVNKVIITLTVKLPNGDEAVIDSGFAN